MAAAAKATTTDGVAAKAAKAEKKSANFKKLAVKRVNKALHELKLIANLRAANYVSTTDQRDKIVKTLRNALENVEAVFAGDVTESTSFDL